MASDRFAHIQFSSSLASADSGFRRRPPRTGSSFQAVLNAEPCAPPDPDVTDFLNWLSECGGLEPGLYRPGALARRLKACLRALGVGTLVEARRAVQKRPALVAPALDALLIGVTRFFRDPAIFERLQRDIIPAIAAGSGPIRIWSAGCSDGKEIYSVAMVLAALGALDRSELFGTDCRSTAVEQARRATFNRDALADVPPNWQHHFNGEEESFTVPESIRARSRFWCHDLFSGEPPHNMDLVLCRNLAIYLQPEAAGRLWRRIALAVRPGGFLITGKSERADGVGLVRVAPAIYSKPRGSCDEG